MSMSIIDLYSTVMRYGISTALCDVLSGSTEIGLSSAIV